MGKHRHPLDREYGIVAGLLLGDDMPTIRQLRVLVDHFDDVARDLGVDPSTVESKGCLVIGKGDHHRYRTYGWHAENMQAGRD